MKLIITLCCIFSLAFTQYSLRTEHIGGAQRAGDENTFRASLLKDGNVLHTIERTLPFDVPFPSAHLNEETGMLVLCFTFDGFAEMYDPTGDKVWEQNFFKEMEPNYERTITVALGKHNVAFLTSDVMLPKAKAHFFTVNGAKQWERELPYSMGYEIAMSPDEKTVVAGSYIVTGNEVQRSAAIFSNKGEAVGDINILFRKSAFSDDNTRLALMSERELAVVSLESKKEISRVAKQQESAILTDVCWVANSFVVQEARVEFQSGKKYQYADPIFTRYSKDLVKQAEQQISNITYQRSRLVPTSTGVEFRFDEKKEMLKLK